MNGSKWLPYPLYSYMPFRSSHFSKHQLNKLTSPPTLLSNRSYRSMTTILTTCLQTSPLHPPDTPHTAGSPFGMQQIKSFPSTKTALLAAQVHGRRGKAVGAINALPDWPLMAVLVEHMDGERDLITHKSIWHLSDATIKNVYLAYAMFTCWGCCFFGSTKDPFYDSEQYRGDGGDGTGNWVYTKQEDIEENARQELLREELIEEIEQKVGGLRELGEAREEELVK